MKTLMNRSPKQNHQRKRPPAQLAATLACAALATVAAFSSGCGKPAFVVGNSQNGQQSPGRFAVPPKVDILLMQDDTGSSRPIFGQISSQLRGFLDNLQSQGWDYHLATAPLTTFRPIQQVQASRFDPNWGSLWQTPFPGADISSVFRVSPSAFRTPDNYTDFLDGSDTSSALGGVEPGLQNLRGQLSDPSVGPTRSGFKRPDALLAIVLLSTGNDTSGRYFCSGPYGENGGNDRPCDEITNARNGTHPNRVCGTTGSNPRPYCNNYEESLTVYTNYINWLGSPSQVRFYPVVANGRHIRQDCAGANSFDGGRYRDVIRAVGGQSFDICTTPIPTALTGIAANLATLELTFFTHFLFMDQEPDPATIRVYRHPGGDASQRVEIFESQSDGWTFVGNLPGQNTTSIGSPSAERTLNFGSGWAVQLHGSGILSGSDTATVEFRPAGLQNSGG
jgi:hypothetical protein